MRSDALVIGGGPAGATAAISIATQGHSVVLLEQRPSSRPGSHRSWLLNHEAFRDLHLLGVDLEGHEITEVRFSHHHNGIERPLRAGAAYSVSQDHLFAALRQRSRDVGVEVLEETRASTPIIDRGLLRGTICDSGLELRSEYTVIADGANSTFGRNLGTYRRRDLPYLIAINGTWSSSRATAPTVNIALDLIRSDESPLAGYGWLLPNGDDSVTAGVVVPSTVRDVESVNLQQVLINMVTTHSGQWDLHFDSPLELGRERRLPIGGSVGPILGPTFVVAGDAAATADPLSGIGVSGAVLSGGLAGSVVADAISTGASAPLQRYSSDLAAALQRRRRLGRVMLPILGHKLGRFALPFAAHSRAAADALLRSAFDTSLSR